MASLMDREATAGVGVGAGTGLEPSSGALSAWLEEMACTLGSGGDIGKWDGGGVGVGLGGTTSDAELAPRPWRFLRAGTTSAAAKSDELGPGLAPARPRFSAESTNT